jgi:hypothetical protein
MQRTEIRRSSSKHHVSGEHLRRTAARRWLPSLLLLCLTVACGGESGNNDGGGGGNTASLSISPASLTLIAGGGPVIFTADLATATATVSWTLSGPGSIDPASGNSISYASSASYISTSYTPPASVASATTATLTATSGTRTASATITVNPPPTISSDGGTPGNCPSSTPVTGPPIEYGTFNHMTISGHVTDETCAAVANAWIEFDYVVSSDPLTSRSFVKTTTDASGAYSVSFDAYNGDVEFAYVWGADPYETDYRYPSIATKQATYDFHVRHIDVATIGTPHDVTLVESDPVCVNNVQDMQWPDWKCHTLRAVAPTTGTLSIQMTQLDAPSSKTQLEAEAIGGFETCCSTTAALSVSAGQTVLINPELIWGGASTSVRITTSMSSP